MRLTLDMRLTIDHIQTLIAVVSNINMSLDVAVEAVSSCGIIILIQSFDHLKRVLGST